jgi:acetolactate synthase small subunit
VAQRILSVFATDSRWVPVRICGLLAQRNVTLDAVRMSRSAGDERWQIDLVVSVDGPQQSHLLAERLGRLVDVVDVVEATSIQPIDQR